MCKYLYLSGVFYGNYLRLRWGRVCEILGFRQLWLRYIAI